MLGAVTTKKVSYPSAGSPIGGAVATARAILRGLIGMIARVAGVTFPASRVVDVTVTAILDSHVVVATPEIREATDTTNPHDI